MLRVNPRIGQLRSYSDWLRAVTDDQEALIQRNAAHLFYKPSPERPRRAHRTPGERS